MGHYGTFVHDMDAYCVFKCSLFYSHQQTNKRLALLSVCHAAVWSGAARAEGLQLRWQQQLWWGGWAEDGSLQHHQVRQTFTTSDLISNWDLELYSDLLSDKLHGEVSVWLSAGFLTLILWRFVEDAQLTSKIRFVEFNMEKTSKNCKKA